jgi:predicted MFS family arabinose efflux permease
MHDLMAVEAMGDELLTATNELKVSPPRWNAVLSLSLTVIGFIIAEMLPASLLTPMATDLHVREGMAGQTVTTTSVVALFASLGVAAVTRRFDRRHVVLSLAALLVASNLLVAFAANYPMLLAGRFLLGLGLGGFWSMIPAIVTRLVPQSLVPRALSIIFAGVSVGMVLAVPVGSFFGGVVGWRGIFWGAALIGIVGLAWHFRVLPSISPSGQSRWETLIEVLRRPQMGPGLAGMVLFFGGHFIFFTYLRPFLERVTEVGVTGIAGILLGFGVANILGTLASGAMIQRNLRLTLALTPLLMAGLAVGLVLLGTSKMLTLIFVAAWGFTFGVIPVAWTTWLINTVPDETESAGGIQVASIQAAIATGAGLGGFLLDASGPSGAFMGSSALLLLAAASVLIWLRPHLDGPLSVKIRH